MRYRAEDFQKDFWVNIGKRIRLRREQFGLTRDQLSLMKSESVKKRLDKSSEESMVAVSHVCS